MKTSKRAIPALTLLCAALITATLLPPAVAAANKGADTQLAMLQEILDGIDKRYSGPGFSASFFQASTLMALGITDTATGRLTVKRPDKMQWIYDAPESQTLITDGQHLWIYRPTDNQVMLGAAPAFFKDGKGASFLTDTRLVREQFHVSLVASETPETQRLQLIPRKPQADIARIFVVVDRGTYEVTEIVTINTQGDETRIKLSGIVFKDNLPDSLFQFTIPEGVDIISLDE